MNYYGSYRRLLENSKIAMLSAIEIYNKPQIQYREECFVILFINSWELLLKALLSKNREKIYYPKRRNEPYKTISLTNVLKRSEKFFPKNIDFKPTEKNILLCNVYRDNTIHFYNNFGFQSLIYSLAQTGIKNYVDLTREVFEIDFGNEINWRILPLSFTSPTDPLKYLKSKKQDTYSDPAVEEFLKELKMTVTELQNTKMDLGRLLTVFDIKLESIKKIDKADFVAAVGKPSASINEPIFINRSVDPNISHPLRQQHVMNKIQKIHGRRFTSYVFQAIIQKYDLKNNPNLSWVASEGVLTKYSNDIIPWIERLSKEDIEQAIKEYRKRLSKKTKK